jgi:hypothetical protein
MQILIATSRRADRAHGGIAFLRQFHRRLFSLVSASIFGAAADTTAAFSFAFSACAAAGGRDHVARASIGAAKAGFVRSSAAY